VSVNFSHLEGKLHNNVLRKVAVSEIPAQLVYYDIFFEIEDSRQIPILGYYKDGFVVLQSLVKQELLEGMTSELTEVYHIEDVNDHILSKINGSGESSQATDLHLPS